MSRMVEFENLLEIFESKIDTDEFKKLQKDFDEADNIYFIASLVYLQAFSIDCISSICLIVLCFNSFWFIVSVSRFNFFSFDHWGCVLILGNVWTLVDLIKFISLSIPINSPLKQ